MTKIKNYEELTRRIIDGDVELFEKITGKRIEDFMPSDREYLTRFGIITAPLENFLNDVPIDSTFDGSCGVTENKQVFYAITEEGVLSSPDPNYIRTSNNSYFSPIDDEGVSLGVAWGASLGKIKYLVIYQRDLDSWRGREEIDEDIITLVLVDRHLDDDHLAKIRRRVEDHLRKTSDQTLILRTACLLGVNLDFN